MLRYVGFYTQLALHAVLGFVLAVVLVVTRMPIWLFVVIFAVTLGTTAFVLPWRLGRYEELAERPPRERR